MSAPEKPPEPPTGRDTPAPTGGRGTKPDLDRPSSSTVADSQRTCTWVNGEAAAAPAPAAAPPLPQIPGYEVLSELGRGGMGVVYAARQTALNRVVALKMIRAGTDASAEELARFRVEAQAVARLSHPNIVQIHEVGEHEQRPFFSLEFCTGGTLAAHLRQASPAPRQAAELIETLARAVQHAHVAGIVHRDLKPANILLQMPNDQCPMTNQEPERQGRREPSGGGPLVIGHSSLGIPKITDFGLAKQLDADADWTRSGAIMGTPAYMAPEQAGGAQTVGPLADVYALGAILYECLTGRPPFTGTGALDIVDRVRRDDPVPPRRLQPRSPRDLETICLKCLQKDPLRRYQSALEVAQDLRRFLDHEPIHARPAGVAEKTVKWLRRRPTPVLASALVLLAVAAVAGGAWLWQQLTEADARARAEREANLVTTAYYANLTRRRGEPEGVGPLTEDEAYRRQPGYRFHQRGGTVERVDILNAHLVYEDRTSLPSLLGFPRSQNIDFPIDSSLYYTRDEQGRVAQEEARDAWGQINWTLSYSEDGTAYFADRRTSPSRREVTRRVHVRFTWDAAGFPSEIRYLDEQGRPQPTDQGVHGVRLEQDRGLITRLTALDARDRPTRNGEFPAVWTQRYDDRGDPAEDAHFTGSGKPATYLGYHRRTRRLTDEGAVEEVHYDAAGRGIVTHAGYHRVTLRVAEWGTEAECAFFDVAGRPMVGRQGFHRFLARFDERGHEVEMRYFAPDGQPARHDDYGGTRRTASFDDRGTPLERAYWISDGRGGYLLRLRENAAGSRLEEAFFDAAGRPTLYAESGAHRWTARYNDAGRRTELAWFGLDGAPVLHRKYRNHRWTVSYDARGHELEGANFGIYGEPVLHLEGMHRWHASYDRFGNKTEMAYFGTDGRPIVPHQPGYARQAWTFDPSGRPTGTATWLLDGKGEYALRLRQDGAGRVLEEGLFDDRGRPTTDPAGGYHRWKNGWNAQGQLAEQAYFGFGGEPVVSRDSGNHRWTAKFDARGNMIEGANFGVKGEPVLHRDGMHRWEAKYDGRGNRTAFAAFGTGGEPILSTSRSHRWTKRFDDRGRLIDERHSGTDDKPIVCKQGFARRTHTYAGDRLVERVQWVLDEKGAYALSRRETGQGKMLERRYYTAAGGPGADPTSGAHRVTQAVDERGNVTEQAHFNFDGLPVLHAAVKTHRRTLRYDDRNLVVQVAHFDTAGKPMVMPAAGSHSWTYRYDERGNKVEQEYFGVSGESVNNRFGYHRVTIRYDEAGKEVGRVHTDVKGERVEPRAVGPEA